MPLSLELLILAIFFVWLIVLTFFFTKFYFYYSRIIKNSKKDSLVKILDDVNLQEKSLEKKIDKIESRCDKLEKDVLFHIQKVGLLRFNPFKDTGGDQSFILALLDAKDTGVLISSFHTRTGTRWYAKRIVNGKGIEYELSEDEKKALKETSILTKN